MPLADGCDGVVMVFRRTRQLALFKFRRRTSRKRGNSFLNISGFRLLNSLPGIAGLSYVNYNTLDLAILHTVFADD